MNKKGIIFIDFNGVISYKPFWFSLKNTSHPLNHLYSSIENFLFKENISLVKDWMIGKYTSEEIHRILEENVDIPYKEIFEIFVNDSRRLDVSRRILKEVRKMRSIYYFILITDNMDSFTRFTLPHNKIIAKSFNEIYDSYSMKASKRHNNGIFFKEKIKALDFCPSQCYLIDDSNKNCTIFNSLGGKAFNTKNKKDVIDALGSLKYF